MLDKNRDVQGIALYAEFRKPGAMLQLFVTPDGYALDDKEVPATMWRRVLTPATPKKQWRNSSISMRALTELNGEALADEKREEFTERRMSFATQLFDSLKSGGWSLTREPLFIETSKKDLEDVKMSKTPNKLLYRINQTRDAQGFPAEIA